MSEENTWDAGYIDAYEEIFEFLQALPKGDRTWSPEEIQEYLLMRSGASAEFRVKLLKLKGEETK